MSYTLTKGTFYRSVEASSLTGPILYAHILHTHVAVPQLASTWTDQTQTGVASQSNLYSFKEAILEGSLAS